MYENTVRLTGFVGSIEVIETEGKTPVAKVSVSTHKYYLTKDGKKVDSGPMWHTLFFFDKKVDLFKKRAARNEQPLITKGSLIAVKGALQYSEWESKSGEKHITASINVNSVNRLIDPKRQYCLDHMANM